MWARSMSTRARWNSSSGPASAVATSPRAASNAPAAGSPAPRAACAPHVALGPLSVRRRAAGTRLRRRFRREPGRARRIAPARARPPRRGRPQPRRGATPDGQDRPADRSSPPAPRASAVCRRMTPTGRPPSAPADAGTAPGRQTPPAPPPPPAPAWTGIPSRPAARHTSDRSPDGSAAASCSSRRVPAGRAASWRAKLSSIRPDSGAAPGRPNPPASSAGVNPRGSSSNASGLPRVSATIRSRTRASSGPASADSSSARASLRPTRQLPARQPGQLRTRIAGREHQPDRVRRQAARHEP